MSDDIIQSTFITEYLTPFKKFITDDNVNEISLNPDGSVFVEYGSKEYMQKVELTVNSTDAYRLGSQLAGETNNTLSEKHPIVSGRVIVWGSILRVEVLVPPAVENGVSVSIRRFMTRILDSAKITFLEGKPVDLDAERRERHQQVNDMAAGGNLSGVLRHIVDNKFNIVISGGTSSGKTTIARTLLSLMNQEERIITIEDALELNPPHPNHVCLVADSREGSQRQPAKLLKSILRMRPDRLMLGEIRGPEAYNFLEAINTGHPGSLTTIHANTPKECLHRLALLVGTAGVKMENKEVLEYAKRTIDVVIQVGRKGNKRGVLAIYLPALE